MIGASNVVLVYWLLLPTLGVAAFVALQHAMIWLSDREDDIARWTAVWAFASFVYITTRFIQKTHLDPVIAIWCIRVGLFALCALVYALVEMVRVVVGLEVPGLGRNVLRVLLVLTLLIGLSSTWLVDVALRLRADRSGVVFYGVAHPRMFVPLMLSGVLALFLLVRSLRYGRVLRDHELVVERNLFLIGVCVMALFAINDVMQVFEVYNFLFVSELMPMPLAVAMSVITARRQRNSRVRLEARVADRTLELSDSNRQLQEALRDTMQSESNLRLLFEATPDAIVVVRDATITTGNSAALRLLGEVRDRRLDELIVDLDPRALPTDQPQPHDYRRADGSVGQCELSCKELMLEGRPITLFIVRDLTERKLLEGQLQKAERLAALGTLAASVAHEVNNPLSYVHGNVALLKQELDDLTLTEAQRKSLTVIVDDALEGSNRVRDIVRDLQRFGRGDGNEGNDTIGPVDLRRVLQKADRVTRAEVRTRARLTTELSGSGVVRGNELRLMQIVVNLVVNAAQAMNTKDVARNRIDVRVSDATDNDVLLAVSDNGPGMTETQVQRIFEPFFSTKRGSGTGLGVSVTRDLVRQLGGTITVESALHTGTTFRVTLPRAQLADLATAPPVSAPPPSARTSQWRLLVIDDEPLIGRAIDRMLPDHVVTVVHTAAEAIAQLTATADWDVVMCDAFLDGDPSTHVFRHLATTCPHLGTRLIVMTGGTPTEVAAMGAPKGALMLWKPFDDKHLFECLQVLADLRDQKA